MGCATTLNLVRRPDAQGTETEVEGDQIRPRGCQVCWVSSGADGGCAAARSPGLGPILSRICLESVSSRDKSPNSASYSPLRGSAYYITNVNDDGTIPQFPQPNYKAYNNFRSGDLSPPDGKKTPDAVLDVAAPCVHECKDGKLVLWVNPGNIGASPVTTPTTIEVLGVVNGQDVVLGNHELLDVIDPGKYLDAVAFVVDPVGLESITVSVSVKEQECDLANNAITLPGPFCE